jgi:hypothetical protein
MYLMQHYVLEFVSDFFVLFLLDIVLFDLPNTDSDYFFGLFKLFLMDASMG